jgi:hypothetical protein
MHRIPFTAASPVQLAYTASVPVVVPRRNRLDQMVPAERAIYDAGLAVEDMPADERLTRAVNLLTKARGLVADFVDSLPVPREDD